MGRSPTDHLREGVDRVGKVLKDPDKEADERRVAIGTAVDKIFDFSETAKRALGQHWAQRTPAERGICPPLHRRVQAYVRLQVDQLTER